MSFCAAGIFFKGSFGSDVLKRILFSKNVFSVGILQILFSKIRRFGNIAQAMKTGNEKRPRRSSSLLHQAGFIKANEKKL